MCPSVVSVEIQQKHPIASQVTLLCCVWTNGLNSLFLHLCTWITFRLAINQITETSTLNYKAIVHLGKTKISLVILALHNTTYYFIISTPTASYEITLKLYGVMKKVHCAHLQSCHELFQDFGQSLLLVTVRQCAGLIRQITANIPFNA